MLELSGSTLNDALRDAARAFGASPVTRLARADGAFEDLDRPAFLEMALRVARWCRDQGLAQRDRAIICLENSPAWGAAYFGVLLAGGVAVPVDAQSSPADAAYYLDKTRARLVFAHRRELFPDPLPDGCALSVGMEGPLAAEALSEAAAHRPHPGNLAALLFTSGTTGKPKAVMLTHANLMANVEAIRRTGLVTPADNFLAVLPLHHAYPCMVNLLVPLFTGACATFVESPRPDAILGALKAAGVTILVLTPQYVGVFYRRILARIEALPMGLGRLAVRLLTATAGRSPDPLALARRAVRRGVGPRFRFFLTGGARGEPEVMAGMAALGLPVIEGYGLSETAPVISFNHPERGAPGSVGAPLEGVDVRLDRVGEDGFGELLVRGPNVMPGYFEDPDATARALDGGWLRTGDQARLDEAGRIFIRGRERDIIVLPSGKKFPAEEVENHYRRAPSVADICVLQGEDGGLRAVVVPDREFLRATDSPDVRQNIRWDLEVLSRELPAYRRIGTFTIVTAELPKTRLGKVKRHLVEQMLERGGQDLGGGGDPWPDYGPGGNKAAEALRTVSGVEAFGPSAHLELDLGIDSLKRLELLSLLEDVLGRPVPEERFQGLDTAGEVAALAGELAGGEEGSGVPASDQGGLSGGAPATGDAQSGRVGRAGLAVSGESGTAARSPTGAVPGLGGPAPLPDLGAAGQEAAGPSRQRPGGDSGPGQGPGPVPGPWPGQGAIPEEDLAAKAPLVFGPADRLAADLLWLLVAGAAKAGFGLEVRGRENIPEDAAIIAPNHASFLDGFMVFAGMPRRHRLRLHFLGLARFFESRPVRRLAARFRLISVDASRISQVMRLSAHVLRNGKLLCVFPEGARTPNGELQEFRQGPVRLSKELGVPVVPTAITGTYEAWPVNGKLKLHKVKVTFGKPMMPESPEDVREAVRAMLP